MSGYVEMLVEDADADSMSHDFLKRIQSGLSRAGELVKQILMVSRQSKGKASAIKIQTIAKEAAKLTRASIPSTIKIESQIDDQCSPVFADPTQIHQIIMNLVTNAYHAIEPDTGTLKISLKEVELGDEQRAVFGQRNLHNGFFNARVGTPGHRLGRTRIILPGEHNSFRDCCRTIRVVLGHRLRFCMLVVVVCPDLRLKQHGGKKRHCQTRTNGKRDWFDHRFVHSRLQRGGSEQA